MLNSCARFRAFANSHEMCSVSSVSRVMSNKDHDEMSPLDAVLRLTRDGSQSTQRNSSARSMHIQLAFNTACDGRKDNPGLASETFSTTVDQWLQAVDIILVYHSYQSSIDPSSCFNTVQAANDDVELEVVVLVLVLNLAAVRVDLDSFDAIFDEASSHLGLVFSDICLTEEELAIEIGYVDRVCFVIQYGAEGEVLEDFASEAASSAEKGQALDDTFAGHKVIRVCASCSRLVSVRYCGGMSRCDATSVAILEYRRFVVQAPRFELQHLLKCF
ncbi:putative NEDD8 activating enzyme, partial [Aureobasidium melanogenum]